MTWLYQTTDAEINRAIRKAEKQGLRQIHAPSFYLVKHHTHWDIFLPHVPGLTLCKTAPNQFRRFKSLKAKEKYVAKFSATPTRKSARLHARRSNH